MTNFYSRILTPHEIPITSMTDAQKLIWVKIAHTAIWVFFNAVFIYLFYAVLTRQVGTLFWLGVGLILVECVVLLSFKWTCPLTIIARKYSDSTRDNFDIYLPNWLARHNKTIYSALFVFLFVLYFFNR